MGTRNLTCVVKNGEYKIAKYCQWDEWEGKVKNEDSAFLKKQFETIVSSVTQFINSVKRK